METTPTISELGQRARKAAAKRLGLLDALLDRLATRPLPSITVQELCDEVNIVEQTFFNTFPSKPSVLVFFVMLWSVEMQWRMQRASSAEDALRALFDASAEQQKRSPWLMPEIIVHQIRAKAEGLPESAPPTLAEKLLRFPEMPGIDAIEPLPVQALIGTAIAQAIAHGELPLDTDAEHATRLLCGLFFGAAASIPYPDGVADLLRRGFNSLWEGLGRRQKENRT